MKKLLCFLLAGLLTVSVVPVQASGIQEGENPGARTVTAWELKSVKTDKSSPQEKGASIEVSAEIAGASDGLKYKFVWMKDNWKKWGILQDFSSENSAEWVPEETGTYTLYADVKDAAGTVKTKSITYEIQKVNWQLNGIDVSPEAPQKINQEIEIKADVSGNTTGLRYKYVWMKDNWKEWGVIQDFSTERQAAFRPETKGTYTIITNVKDLEGEVRTKSITYEVMTKVWKYEGIETGVASPQEKYCDPITVCVKTTGETDGLKYKFVWSRDGWKEWGVLQDFSAKNSVKWTPGEAGEYQLIVNIKTTDGEVVTKSIPYTITKVQWSYDGIKAAPEGVQKKGEVVEIEAKAGGNTEGLQYKYVWMKDNWKKWGVIQSFSGKNTAEWKTPKESGTYQIIVDVKDRDGNVITKQISYDLVTQFWNHEGIDINGGVQEQIYTKIPVTAKVSGETENLQYKFVWTKNNWEKWGVIREFSSESTAQWYPKEPGTYTIYCNIKDPDGRVQTRTEEYTVLDAPWQLDEITFSGSGSYYVGDTMTVRAVTSGETEGLQYKFVCRRGENWDDWEVVQEFSPNNTVTIPVEKAVNYHIYVDIKDARGVTFDAVEATGKGYTYNLLQVSSGTTSKGNPVDITPQLTGPSGAKVEYKYVWMKDNWSQWGVIKEFSDAGKISWTPTEIGTYTILVDVKINGIVKTKSATVVVTTAKNGWYYEGGYKFYYVNNVKQLDLDGILPRQSSYYIKVNRQCCTVTVYAKDGNNGYIIPVKRFACSVGLPSTPTPTGTFTTSSKYRWHELMGPSYGQYCTRIVGGVLFHSVAGYNQTSYNLSASAYNKLGSPASHGCVRLCVRDAKWIYDNCPSGTKVTIYDSSYPGPLGKPATIKIPAGQNWDPTDPNVRR